MIVKQSLPSSAHCNDSELDNHERFFEYQVVPAKDIFSCPPVPQSVHSTRTEEMLSQTN